MTREREKREDMMNLRGGVRTRKTGDRGERAEGAGRHSTTARAKKDSGANQNE